MIELNEQIVTWIIRIVVGTVIIYAMGKTFFSMHKHSKKLEELESAYNISKGRVK